jgi:uncharacterized cupin superfamily protein
VGLTHFDDARQYELAVGHLNATWSLLGEAAGCRTVGVRRIEVHEGGWSTPAHEHGRSEEIFYVLGGQGLSWQRGEVAEIREGDCIVYRPGTGAHTLHALTELDVLAFGPRMTDESPRFPRLGFSLLGGRWVESLDGVVDGFPIQFVREAEVGPPELSESAPRPNTIVNLADVEGKTVEREHVSRTRRNLGIACGSVTTGLQHVEVAPDKESAPLHCHSLEEEIFVVLDGDGVLVLDDEEETPVRQGSVVARPAGTGVSHLFRAGDSGLTYLAYGTREPGDVCYYPRSNKISFGGVGVIGRIEKLDYWDGED